MNNLENTLEKLKRISENFNSAPSFAAYKIVNNKKIYQTNMSQFADKIEIGIIDIGSDKKEKILNKWYLYLQNNQQQDFSAKEIEVLSFEASVVKESKFWDLLLDIENITPRIIIGLVYGIYANWSNIQNFDSVVHIVRKFLFENKKKNRVIDKWKEDIDLIISKNTPKLIAKKILDNNISMSDIEKEFFLNITNTNLSQIVYLNIIEEKLIKLLKANSIKLDDVKSLIEEINGANISKKNANKFYPYIIKAVDNSKTNKHILKEYIKDYFINDLNYKDPRYFPEKWLTFEEEAKKIIIYWLNEQDIRIFFDIFIDNDPHGRKDFWLKYLRQVKTTKIIQCPSLHHNEARSEEINKLKAKGVSIANIYDLRSNVFILEFDNFIAVEFSEAGNACYLYNKKAFNILDTNKNTYYKDDLKNKTKTITTFSHVPYWQKTLASWMASRGVTRWTK